MLDALRQGFRAARDKLSGAVELTDDNLSDALRLVRLSLLDADVGVSVADRFLERVKTNVLGNKLKAAATVRGAKVQVGPAEAFIKACHDELLEFMRDAEPGLTINRGSYTDQDGPDGILMVGLQGSGKTTTSAKLAAFLQKQGFKPLLVAADTYRPGAIDQLQVLGERIDVPVFTLPGAQPPEICSEGQLDARRRKRDVVIYDTAGRLTIDDTLMVELEQIRGRVHPKHTLLVIDAMMGQDAVATARGFGARLDLNGVVLTKLDGDARGGAALSVREVTGAPIKFVGMGEGMDRLEEFRPEGMADRILGFGDVVGLMKDFEEVVDVSKAERDAKRMLQGSFGLHDFLEQIRVVQKMGPLQDVLDKLPFFSESMPKDAIDERQLGRIEAMISSMTPAERDEPELFRKAPSRVRRVARGSGHAERDVVDLLNRFVAMRQMLSNIGKQAGMLAKNPMLKKLAKQQGLRDHLVIGDGGGNPFFDHLTTSLLESAVATHGGPALNPLTSRRQALEKKKKKDQRKQQRQARRKARR